VNAESLYVELSQLIAEMPTLGGTAPITPEINRWLGRAAQLVKETGNYMDHAAITVASDGLTNVLREQHAQQIAGIVFRAMAFAEANAAAERGGFVGVGTALDVLQVVGKLLAEVRKDALIVDPNINSSVFTDFAPTAPEGAGIRILADGFFTEPEALRPATVRWKQQFGVARPLEVRLSAPRALHDRLVFADGTKVWSLSHPLKDFAARLPTLAQRLDPDLAKMKVDFYEQVWASATPVS